MCEVSEKFHVCFRLHGVEPVHRERVGEECTGMVCCVHCNLGRDLRVYRGGRLCALQFGWYLRVYWGGLQWALYFGVISQSVQGWSTMCTALWGEIWGKTSHSDCTLSWEKPEIISKAWQRVRDWLCETGSGWETGLGGRTGARRVTRFTTGWTTVI